MKTQESITPDRGDVKNKDLYCSITCEPRQGWWAVCLGQIETSGPTAIATTALILLYHVAKMQVLTNIFLYHWSFKEAP